MRAFLVFLWWGVFRHVFRVLVYRLNLKQILTGPLAGYRFKGTYSQLLGIYEMPIESIIVKELESAKVFYDIGANYGYFSLLGAKLLSKGTVYAFEPLPDNVKRIEENIAANSIANCILIGKAVSKNTGTAQFAVQDGVSSSLIGESEETVPVETISLDDFIQDTPIPGLIKLDVEGAESMVLEGAKGLLARDDAPKWIIEIHNEEQMKLVRDSLQAFNYQQEIFESRNRKFPCHLLAVKAHHAQ